MKKYMENYCIKLEVPSLYVQNAKFFVKDPSYCLKLLNLVHPKGSNHKVIYHRINKKSSQSISKDINEDLTQGILLRLIRTSGKSIQILKDILIKKVHYCLMTFSFDGNFVVFYYKDLQ